MIEAFSHMRPHHMPNELHYYNHAHVLFMLLPFVMFGVIMLVLKLTKKYSSRKVLFIVSLVNVVIYVSYKVVMACTFDTFDIWGELPLQLCNINIFLIPIALIINKRTVYSYLYFVGAIGAMCAFPFFDVYFLGRPPFSYPVMAFFVFHAFLVSMPVAIVFAKIYTPKMKDIISALIMLVVLALIMHGVNLLFRATKLCADANYFYTMGMRGNPLMDLLWHLVPIPFVFFLPILLPVIPVQMLMALPFYLKQKKCNQQTQQQ